jgi:hypothetical protein
MSSPEYSCGRADVDELRAVPERRQDLVALGADGVVAAVA